MSQLYKAIVVSETHWDRAWYLPFQVYRVRLVRLIDRLLQLLEDDPTFHSFMLDGQMSLVEDYLAIRPEKRAKLAELVQAKRLFVGPWYVLADEYLVSPEALIRNLQLGMKIAGTFGNIMTEGYTPDSFGHIAQLPQILQGFGIDSVIFWRGFGDEADELGNEFWWDAPNGARVLAVHLRDGYHNIANIGYATRGADRSAIQLDMALAMQQMRSAVDLLKPHAQTPYLLLLDGVDHAEANRDITGIIAQANELLEDVEIEHGTLPAYIAHVREALGKRKLPAFTGEFNRGKYAHVLQSVYATRIYLKQANERAQRLLESYSEPLSAWAWVLGAEYPDALLWEAWRTLLKNHPHDDICGCSVDEVHREDMQRFAEVEQIGKTLARDSARQIMAKIDRTTQEGLPFVLFNLTSNMRSDTVEMTLIFDQNDDTYQTFHLVDASGDVLSMQILEESNHFAMEVRKNHYQRRVRVAVSLPELPAMGYHTIYAMPGEPDSPSLHLVVTTPTGMENDYLRVLIYADGTLYIWDKTTHKTYHQLGYFLDEEDAGDEYDYAPCPHPKALNTVGKPAQIRLVHTGMVQVTYEIKREWVLPASLTPDRQHRSEETVVCTITSLVTLRGDNEYVEIETTVNNRAKDHRLRVCFPTDLQTDVATADGHFDVITRDIDIPVCAGWVQPPVPTKHQRTFVDVSDGEVGLAIFNRGLPEYEIQRGRTMIVLTLLRGVDMLFRDDLLTRPGYAWLPAITPDAQCLGTHTFSYAIAPHTGNWETIYETAQLYRLPVYVRCGTEREGFLPMQAVPKERQEYQLFKDTVVLPLDLAGELPATGAFLTIDDEEIVISAVKRSESGELLVVRVFNVYAEETTFHLRLFCPIQSAYELNMKEDVMRELRCRGNTVAVDIAGKEVKTIGLKLSR